MSRFKLFFAVFVVTWETVALPAMGAASPVHSLQVLSKVYPITQKYKSMEGPASSQPFVLMEGEPPELAWITRFRTEIVGADGQTPESPEFMCHINLDANMMKHRQLFGGQKYSSNRIFTLSQAQFDAEFPDGFGIPVITNEKFSLATQVLNHNFENPNYQVRHKVTVDYVLDKDLKKPLKPLFATNAYVMRLLEGKDGYFGMSMQPDPKMHGESCLPGENAPAARGLKYSDGLGRKFSGHWVVPPGRETSHTNVTKTMNVPFDTTVHYINIHLHPFAESLELRDITANKTIFKSKARGPKGRIGLSHIDTFSSKKGIPIYKDHQYELTSVYDNPTGVNQDAMATMFLYLLDKEFKQPDLELAAVDNLPVLPIAAPAAVTGKEPYLLLTTTNGNMLAVLYPDVAPHTVDQIRKLVQGGVYDGMPFVRLEPNFVLQTAAARGKPGLLTQEQLKIVHPLPAEFSGTPHERGILSMARETDDVNSGETSFSILLSKAPHLDAKYTVFGKVVKGLNVLASLEKLPTNAQKQPATPIYITKAEILTDRKKINALLRRSE